MLSLTKKVEGKIQCLLCPHLCKLAKGKSGICRVRRNSGDDIELITYGVISGFAIDPVEKKPLYHFFPGQNVLSIGSYGCNLKCDFCQNYHISQNLPESHHFMNSTPENITMDALRLENNIGVAFTYNEPVIWFEFMRDTAIRSKESGLFTIMISNGYVNSEPLSEIIQFIDAFNIDLKSFNNEFYRKVAGAEIEAVKSSLKQIAKSGKHLEITTLIIPGLNDDVKEMSAQAEWIAEELGRDVPFHLSRYFPMYNRNDPATSQETMNILYEIASEKLDYVYTGNLKTNSGQNTCCPECGTIVTTRIGYKTEIVNLSNGGNCSVCGNLIFRYVTLSS
jgi:pyruvate formate lyase activating enzyme